MLIEQFRNHGFWTLIEQAESALQEYPEESKRDEAFEETAEKVSYIRWIMEQSDPSLITPQEFDQASQHLQQIIPQIQRTNGNTRGLRQLDGQFASIVSMFPYPRVRKLFRSEKTEIINEFRYRVKELRKETEQSQNWLTIQSKEFENAVKKLRDELGSVSDKVAKNEARVETQFENWDSKNSAVLNQRLTEIAQRFADEQDKRQIEFQAQLARISANLDRMDDSRRETTEEFSKSAAKLQAEMVEWRDHSQNEANEYLDQIRNIYQIVGQTSLAGDFEVAAKRETTTGTVFAVLAALFFVLAPLFFAWQWGTTQLAHFNVEALILKFSAALAFLVPAAYFGNTSRRHHRVATSLRSLGIRVATFDAYLANFNPTDRNKIKQDMAELFFSAQITPDTVRATTPKEMEKLLGVVDTALSQFEGQLKGLIGK